MKATKKDQFCPSPPPPPPPPAPLPSPSAKMNSRSFVQKTKQYVDM